MSAHQHEHSDQNRHPAGSPAGGRFAPSRRTESGVDLTLVDPSASTDADWTPSETDFAETGQPLPYWAPGSSGFDDENYTPPDDEYVGTVEAEVMADRMEERWFRGTRAGS